MLVPATIYASWTEGRLMPGTNPMWGFVVAVFAAYNGLYYMEMSVKNYQMHLTRTMMQVCADRGRRRGWGYWDFGGFWGCVL